MPLYEYRCRSCDHVFERLVRSGEDVACPSCGGAELDRLLSTFAVDSATTRQMNLNAGRKLLKRTQRDKQIADREELEHHDH